MARQKARGFRQQPRQGRHGDERDDAPGDEQGAPARRLQQLTAKDPGQHRAERHADDGCGHGHRPLRPRHELGRQRGGVGQRAAEPDSGEKPQHRQRRHVVDRGGGHCHRAEYRHAAEQCLPATEAIAGNAGQRTSRHHSRVAQRHGRRERRPIDVPLPHHGREHHAEQLIVDTVEDDRDGGEEHQPSLVGACWCRVEQRADVVPGGWTTWVLHQLGTRWASTSELDSSKNMSAVPGID